MTRFRSASVTLTTPIAAALPSVATAQACGATVPPGIVTPGLTWGLAGSPYCVTGDIQVSLLKVQPGVTVIVDGPYKIEVLTTIQVNGTAENPVTVKSSDNGPWKGIK